ncbi:Cell adhesion molecule 2 [Folsomia candida]|uniref:Cell adhesion molecule 2 n=1 Tax=Folsomia candida TaxID=158441 RepID=A0A226EGD1_FOLCA|nr:Cell adhesion molecule 2 [Folsomia candida]
MWNVICSHRHTSHFELQQPLSRYTGSRLKAKQHDDDDEDLLALTSRVPLNCVNKLRHKCGMLYSFLKFSVLMTVGIRLENVTVPSVAIIGQSVGLECQYRLEDDKLYSLKWYKNDQEFFRYSPNSRPNIVTFQTHGVQVDNQELHNHPNRVTLRSLSLNSSGLFRCEVVSESPVFQTVFKERKLNVIIPPNPGNPHLSKFSPTIHMYEILTGNCTSYKSYPAANLTFYINERKWGSPNVTEYESVKEIDREGKEVWTSVIGLRVRVDNNFFNKGAIRIKCKASILGREWITSKNITHQNKNYQHPLYSSARNQYSSGM